MESNESSYKSKRYAPYKQFIGAIVPNWIMKRTDLSQGSKLCFGRLAQYAGKNDCAFPGHEALAKELGVSVPAVKGYLRELANLGVIESQRMGSGNFNLYFFLNREGTVEFKTDRQKTICQPTTDGHKSNHPDGHNPISPIREENQKENHK